MPKEIEYFKRQGLKVATISAGHSHSGCITENSSPARLFLWGCNPDCRLMIEENQNMLEPTLTLIDNLQGNAEMMEPY